MSRHHDVLADYVNRWHPVSKLPLTFPRTCHVVQQGIKPGDPIVILSDALHDESNVDAILLRQA